ERAVVTSSSATVGPARGHRPTEEDRPPLPARGAGYHASKAWQEVAALSAQLPVVLLLPTAPVGPGDRRPTPTGRVVVDYMRGRIRATVAGGRHVVPREGVARAPVAPPQRGPPGEPPPPAGGALRLGAPLGRLAAGPGRPAPQ